MKNAKKLICILVLGCVVCTHTYNVYQTSYAAEVVVAGGLSAAGVALLALGALAGVGMELDNNRRFNELSDEEKARIENGLATNFEDVALQRGASLEHIKNWTTDLCNGVLDKGSECWGIFKDWIKDVNLTETEGLDLSGVSMGSVTPASSFPIYLENNTYSGYLLLDKAYINNRNTTLTQYFEQHPSYKGISTYVVANPRDGSNFSVTLGNIIYDQTTNKYQIWQATSYVYGSVLSGQPNENSFVQVYSTNVSSWSDTVSLPNNIISIGTQKDDIPLSNGETIDSVIPKKSIFKTNTDYLEKLKGQDEDVIDVIDVTDIKNPIIETRPNSLTNINWNRGTRRTNNNNDDDENKMVTGLVPMDVWYEQIDDEQEQMQNAVVVYNNYIQQHPEQKDTYFISTTPVTNINNYFNTLPVVNIPAQGTIVNNNYEYNNYNNNNVTIYQEPYNTGIIPTFPDFKNKFPFCIPFDLYEFFVVFLAEKEAPKIEIPFPIIDNTNHQLTIEHITIDLAPYEYLSDVLRVMMFILFCVGLMLLTRQLIKG